MWRKPYQVKFCEQDDVLYMTCQWEGKLYAMQPYCAPQKWGEAVEKLKVYFAAQGQSLIFTGIEKRFEELFGRKVKVVVSGMQPELRNARDIEELKRFDIVQFK